MSSGEAQAQPPQGAVLDARWELIAPLRAGLVNRLRNRCASTHDIEDCVQQAMLDAVSYSGLQPSSADAVVGRIAMRRAADSHRDRQRGAALRHRVAMMMTASAGVEDIATDHLAAVSLAGVASTLSELERGALHDRVIGLSLTESAERMGVTYKSAENALRRARNALRAVAAIPGFLLARSLRRLRAAVTAPALAAAAVVVTMVSPGGHGSAPAIASHAPRIAAQFDSSSAHHAASSGSADSPDHVGVPSRRSTGVTSSGASSDAGRSARTTTILVPQVSGPRDSGSDGPLLSTTRHDGAQSLAESVTACLTAGISLQIQDLGCRP